MLAPMQRSALVRQKLLVALPVALVFGLTAALFSTLTLDVAPEVFVRSLVVVPAGAFALTGLAIGLGALFPNFKEDNPARIVSGFGGTLNFLVGMAYTLQQDAHVRVDIFYSRFSKQGQAWVDLCGALFLLLPFMLFISWISWEYIVDSWEVMEGSREAGGLPGVFLLKSLILVMTSLLSLQALTQVARNIETILKLKGDD